MSQLKAGKSELNGGGLWHTNLEGRYWCSHTHERTPEQLLRECQTTIVDLYKNHPEFQSLLDQPVDGNMPDTERCIQNLVIALVESKGWMRDYADSIIRDAIDRTHLLEGEPAKLPAWRGICHPDGTRHLTQNICMNAHQLRNALDFVNPDGAKDTDQLESDLTIQWRKEAVFEGENYPAGLYAYFSEYPEEGSIFLDTDKSTITHPPAPRKQITAEDVTDEMVHDWHANTFGAQAMGGVSDHDMIVAAVNAYLTLEKP